MNLFNLFVQKSNLIYCYCNDLRKGYLLKHELGFFGKVLLSSLLVLTSLSRFPTLHIISVSNLSVFSIEKHQISKSQTAFSWKVKRTSGSGYIQLPVDWTDIGCNHLIRFSSVPSSFQSSTLDHAWPTDPLYPDVFTQSLHRANYLINSRFQGGTIVFWFWPIGVLTMLMVEAGSSSSNHNWQLPSSFTESISSHLTFIQSAFTKKSTWFHLCLGKMME